MSVALAVALSAALALAARRVGALTATGAAAAAAVGTAVLAGTGWAGGAALVAFFVPSSTISRRAPVRGGDAKGACRDHRQVLANGGPAALGALAGLAEPALGLWIATASLAAAAADTWATSAGAWSRTPPRHLLTRRPVAHGASGGVTPLGTLGGLAGALLVASAGAAVAGAPLLLVAAALIGFAGMVADSLLGAAVQGRFRCPRCDEVSEWRRHRCGAETIRLGGWTWLDNDGVNAVVTGAAALAGWAAWAAGSSAPG
ncbi:MAG TPA: DUF92 domain-containing protein [Gemmatimonadales bacterium]|nr:DUF92 domain-containing protein [Gemmatimonadales bacterium]